MGDGELIPLSCYVFLIHNDLLLVFRKYVGFEGNLGLGVFRSQVDVLNLG
jgi:hypothetical protein